MENICRTCLRSPSNLLPLFDETGLPQKIETISSVQVTNDDSLPAKICAECVINVNLSYNFRRIVVNSDIELKQRLFISSLQKETSNSEVDRLEFVQIKIKQEGSDVTENQFLSNNDTTHDGDIVSTAEKEPVTARKGDSIEANKTIQQKETKALNDVRKNVRWRIQSHFIGIKKKTLYKCKICEFTTPEYAKYSNHKRNHFATKSMCNICGKTVRTDNLRKHIGTHTDPPVTCKECGKVFKNSESLRSHLLIHKGIEITCEFCGQIYKYRGGYKRHVRKKHTLGANRKVKCPLCEKMFHEKTDLKKHLRSHTGERPYPCEYCKKGFSSTHALKTHIRQHTKEKPYTCEFCPMAFPQKVSLRTHLKSKHSVQSENPA